MNQEPGDFSNASDEGTELQKLYTKDSSPKKLPEVKIGATTILEERREKNRRSAQLSRRRKLEESKSLEEQIEALSRDNEDLKRTNDIIAAELMRQKVERAKLRQALQPRFAHAPFM